MNGIKYGIAYFEIEIHRKRRKELKATGSIKLRKQKKILECN